MSAAKIRRRLQTEASAAFYARIVAAGVVAALRAVHFLDHDRSGAVQGVLRLC